MFTAVTLHPKHRDEVEGVVIDPHTASLRIGMTASVVVSTRTVNLRAESADTLRRIARTAADLADKLEGRR